jgi:RecA-family ATPase
LLSGEGSVGKSILSLQLAVAVVLGKDWLGSLPEYGSVIVICCEDDEDEIWRRLDLIFTHYGASYSDFDNLHVRPLVDGETLMAVPNRTGIITLTKLFERVREAACDIRPKLIVLDNAADIYGGSENDRAQVRQFINHLRAGLAIPSGAGVLLTSHPSLTGISTGTGLSGSTAWNVGPLPALLQARHHRKGRRTRSRFAGVGSDEIQLRAPGGDDRFALEQGLIRAGRRCDLFGKAGGRTKGG